MVAGLGKLNGSLVGAVDIHVVGYENALVPLVRVVISDRMGTGLGTRIVNNMADAHGAPVEVQSELSVGTTIHCKIPGQDAET